MTHLLTFAAAVRYLRCSPEWLAAMRDMGRVPYQFSPRHEYMFTKAGLDKIKPLVPVGFVEKKVVEKQTAVNACRLAELLTEARELGVSLSEYKRMIR